MLFLVAAGFSGEPACESLAIRVMGELNPPADPPPPTAISGRLDLPDPPFLPRPALAGSHENLFVAFTHYTLHIGTLEPLALVYRGPVPGESLILQENLLVVGGERNGRTTFTVMNLEDPAHPQQLRHLELEARLRDWSVVNGQLVAILAGNNGFQQAWLGERRDPYDPPLPLDPAATLQRANAAFSQGFLPYKDDTSEGHLVPCEAMQGSSPNPAGYTAVLRLPLKGGPIQVQAALGYPGPTAISEDRVAWAAADGSRHLYVADSTVREATLPGAAIAVGLAGEGVTALWSDYEPQHCSRGIPCEPEPPRSSGVSVLESGSLREKSRIVGLAEGIKPESSLLFGHRALLLLRDQLLSVDLRTGSVSEEKAPSGLHTLLATPLGPMATMGEMLRDDLLARVDHLYGIDPDGRISLATPEASRRALPPLAAASQAMLEHPELRALHQKMAGGGEWHTPNAPFSLLGRLPNPKGDLLISSAGLVWMRPDTVTLDFESPVPQECGVHPRSWRMQKVADLGTGDAQDVAVQVQSATCLRWAFGNALYSWEKGRKRKLATLPGQMVSMQFGESPILTTRSKDRTQIWRWNQGKWTELRASTANLDPGYAVDGGAIYSENTGKPSPDWHFSVTRWSAQGPQLLLHDGVPLGTEPIVSAIVLAARGSAWVAEISTEHGTSLVFFDREGPHILATRGEASPDGGRFDAFPVVATDGRSVVFSASEDTSTALYRWRDGQLEVLVPREGGPVVVKRVASNSLSIQGERLLVDASVREGGVGTFLLENCSFIPVSGKEGFSDGFVVGSTSLAPDGTVAFFRSDAQHRLSLWLAIPETP